MMPAGLGRRRFAPTTTRSRVLAVLLAVTTALAGCGGDDETDSFNPPDPLPIPSDVAEASETPGVQAVLRDIRDLRRAVDSGQGGATRDLLYEFIDRAEELPLDESRTLLRNEAPPLARKAAAEMDASADALQQVVVETPFGESMRTIQLRSAQEQRDALLVYARRLENGSPVWDATLKLINRNNVLVERANLLLESWMDSLPAGYEREIDRVLRELDQG